MTISKVDKVDVVILIPAAGASSRMRGRDKLLELVSDEPLLARQTRIACATGANVLVTLPPGNMIRHNALADTLNANLTIRDVARADEGLAASIREAAQWAQSKGASGLMILLADLPDLETEDLNALIDTFATNPNQIWRATDQAGTPGHPVIVPRSQFTSLACLTGDRGARDILARESIAYLALPDSRATVDLDTPEAWQAWRAKTGK